MDRLFAFRPGDLEPVVALFTAALAYCLFHYFTSAAAYARWFGRRGADPARLRVRAWIFQRLGGVFWLGVAPALVAVLALGRRLDELGLRAAPVGLTLAFAGGTLAAVVPWIYVAARRPEHQVYYPEIRLEVWSRRALWTNAWTWTVYLFAYEFFFRGFLLFVLVGAFGTWPGIAVMTGLYVLAHLPKGAGEALGCIPMGVVFSWMTLETGAIWAAVLTHVGIALSSDTLAMRANPAMRLER